MVTPLTFVGDEKALMQALAAGHPGAAAVFYDSHASHVQRTLRSVLGPDEDIPDMLQEVFIRALDRITELREVERVRAWLPALLFVCGVGLFIAFVVTGLFSLALGGLLAAIVGAALFYER